MESSFIENNFTNTFTNIFIKISRFSSSKSELIDCRRISFFVQPTNNYVFDQVTNKSLDVQLSHGLINFGRKNEIDCLRYGDSVEICNQQILSLHNVVSKAQSQVQTCAMQVLSILIGFIYEIEYWDCFTKCATVQLMPALH